MPAARIGRAMPGQRDRVAQGVPFVQAAWPGYEVRHESTGVLGTSVYCCEERGRECVFTGRASRAGSRPRASTVPNARQAQGRQGEPNSWVEARTVPTLPAEWAAQERHCLRRRAIERRTRVCGGGVARALAAIEINSATDVRGLRDRLGGAWQPPGVGHGWVSSVGQGQSWVSRGSAIVVGGASVLGGRCQKGVLGGARALH